MWHQHAATPRRRVVAVREYQITCQIRRRCASPLAVGVVPHRACPRPVTRARPAGSCAVPPRVACAAAAAVGPGVVTGPARRDSTHRDAGACRLSRPVPLRGRASPERRPGRDGRRGDRFRVLYAYPERTTGRSAYPTRNRKRPIRARPDEPGAGPTGR